MSREYYGSAAHLIVSDSCRFHLATRVTGPAGSFLVSTVGDYVGPGDEKRSGDERYSTIGHNRRFETFVFRDGGECDCGCGMPTPAEWCEIDANGYNDRRSANRGHEAMCRKYETQAAEQLAEDGVADAHP